VDTVSDAVLLIGCGRMGGAMARGWATREKVYVHDPRAGAIPRTIRLERLDPEALPMPLTVVVAVKPQVLAEVLAQIAPFARARCLVLSIVAGATLARYAEALGSDARVIRTMPNTPASIGRGVTAAIAAPAVTAEDRERTHELLRAFGQLLWLENEGQMDAVTAVSGSGPAYFFRFAEALARAGISCGLDPLTAIALARETFMGAAALAEKRNERLDALRSEVTSPGGTTAAALAEFERDAAIDELVERAVRAAEARSRELSA
jgi:pyrroline-5-carboxylate reductase